MKHLLFSLITLSSISSAQVLYEEVHGRVIMEAENTASPLGQWANKASISGYTGSGYLEFDGNDYTHGPANSPLEYTFRIKQSGLYYLHLHSARETLVIDGEARTDVANDCYVRVDGNYGAGPNAGDSHGKDAPLALLQKNTKFYGGANGKFAWASGSTNGGHLDPGGHKNKRVAIYNFKGGETYKLVVHGRSRAYKLDRIVFAHASLRDTEVHDLRQGETLGLLSSPRYSYDATEDFPSLESGDIPYYRDIRNNALAIDASIVENRHRFARAARTFEGESGTYDATITTLTEEDGESTYRLLVNGSIVGTYLGTHIGAGSNLDMQPETYSWYGLNLNQGDTIAIESIPHTNGEIAEGDGTAWSRGRWRQLDITWNGKRDKDAGASIVAPPAGRLAIVADGNSPDPDDIGATAVMFGILDKAGLNDRLVHLSHSCDLDPFRNPASKQKIDATNELRRQRKLDELISQGIAFYGPFPNLADYYNCRTEQSGAVNDLRDAINASTAADPLWIIEAGEPDLIGYALQAADATKTQHVHVVSHHPANDNSGDFFSWQQILDFGVTEHQIGDQNKGLQTVVSAWDWAKNHREPGIAWIWENLDYAEQDGVVSFQTNKFDASDAGMIYWWITGASHGGNKNSTPTEMKALLLYDRSSK